MPTYTVTSANLDLSASQEATIAAAITRSHHEATGALAYFAQVIFDTIGAGKHYIGGKAYKAPHLFVRGLIRGGRSSDVGATLVRSAIPGPCAATIAALMVVPISPFMGASGRTSK